MIKLISATVLFLFLSIPAFAQERAISELLQLTGAGASLVLDLRNSKYSGAELIRLASSLKYQATLTLILNDKSGLSISQCVQIARARPGQVIFRF